MSAKDNFFRKVQENKSNQVTMLDKVNSDILSFRSSMFELAKQITLWLDGSDVVVNTAEQLYLDESISTIPGCEKLQTYKVSFCKMQHEDKTALISPVGIYGGGKTTKGWAYLTVNNPRRAPSTQKFLLRLHEDGLWRIRNNDNPSDMNETLNYTENTFSEESFFQAIQSLA